MISQNQLQIKAKEALHVNSKDFSIVNDKDEVKSGIFWQVDELQEFEDGVFAQHDSAKDLVSESNYQSDFIESLFDIVYFTTSQGDKVEQAQTMTEKIGMQMTVLFNIRWKNVVIVHYWFDWFFF